MSRYLGNPAPETPEWYALRAGTIGGSSIAAVMGWSPFTTREQLAEQIAAKATDAKPMSRAMRRGQILEPAIADWLAEDKGLTYDEPASVGIYAHDTFGWATYSPDKITTGGELVEIKTATDRAEDNGWGRAGTDKIPLHYQAQVMWGMGILALPSCWVAVLSGGVNGRPSLDMAVYRLTYDHHIFTRLLTAAGQFMDGLSERTAA